MVKRPAGKSAVLEVDETPSKIIKTIGSSSAEPDTNARGRGKGRGRGRGRTDQKVELQCGLKRMSHITESPVAPSEHWCDGVDAELQLSNEVDATTFAAASRTVSSPVAEGLVPNTLAQFAAASSSTEPSLAATLLSPGDLTQAPTQHAAFVEVPQSGELKPDDQDPMLCAEQEHMHGWYNRQRSARNDVDAGLPGHQVAPGQEYQDSEQLETPTPAGHSPSPALEDGQRTPLLTPLPAGHAPSTPLTDWQQTQLDLLDSDERASVSGCGSETPSSHAGSVALSAATGSAIMGIQSAMQERPPLTRSEVLSKSSGLDASQVDPLCVKCSYPCEVLQSICKTKASATQHAKFICRPCNRVITMMNRKIKLPGPLHMNAWTEQQRLDFFRNASKCENLNGRMNYSSIRGLIKTTLTTRKVEEHKKSIKQDFLPLSVWEKQGYEIAMIVNYNCKEWNPALGWTYTVPLKTISWSSIESDIEEAMLTAERSVKQKMTTGGEGSDLELEVEAEDEDPAVQTRALALETPAEKMAREKAMQQAALVKSREDAAAARKAEKDAEKEKHREVGRIKNHNNKMQILASKAVTALTGHRDQLVMVKKNKTYAEAPPFVKEKVEDALKEGEKYLSMADQVLKSMKKCAKDGSKLPELDFDLSDLNQCVKNMKQAISDAKDFEKLYKRQ